MKKWASQGVPGFGDDLMLGRTRPGELPDAVSEEVKRLHSQLLSYVGSTRTEWAFDGSEIWLLQVQQETALSAGMTIAPGQPDDEVEFDVSHGLSGLRELVELVSGRNVGIKLRGPVGLTSHIADVLRRSRIPSRILAAGS